MKITCKNLSADERADLARLLFKAEHAVRPIKFRETKSGPYIHGIDIQDTKKTAPGGANSEGGKENQSKFTVPQEEGAVNDP